MDKFALKTHIDLTSIFFLTTVFLNIEGKETHEYIWWSFENTTSSFKEMITLLPVNRLCIKNPIIVVHDLPEKAQARTLEHPATSKSSKQVSSYTTERPY